MKRLSVLRVLVLMLATVIALSLWMPSAQAAETEESRSFSTTVTRVNPLYASGDVPAVAAEEEEPTVYTAMDFYEAATALRKIFKNRETLSILAFPVALQSDLTDQAALEAELWAYEEALFQEAMAHTGKGNEGDYLLYSHYLRAMEIVVVEEGDITVMAIMYQIIYHDTAKQASEADKAVKELVDSWDMDKFSDYEKVCAVYDWLCANVTYPDVITEEYGVMYSAYGALVNRVSVCQGYALAMYRMLLELGVDCRIISGTGAGGPHAWNIVRIGDRYYNVDATWDAVRYQAGLDYEWFLTSDANFPDHERDPQYMSESFYAAHPMSPENYAPSVVASGTCGDNLTWELMDERSFYIYGTGPMYDFDVQKQPWADYQEQIGRIYIEDGVTSIGKFAFSRCFYMDEVWIPESVETIGEHALGNCEGIRELLIPEGVVSIGDYAFSFCKNMCNISLPESLTSIGRSAFNYCSSLEKIDLPAGLKSLGQFAFSSCTSLQSASIPASLGVISEHAFAFCSQLESIDIPEGITAIGSSAFRGCYSLQSAALPESLVDIGNLAFGECSQLSDIAIPAGVTSIGWQAFFFCTALSEVTIPAGITALPSSVFQNTGLTSIIIPENVTSIGRGAFENCKSLVSVTLPDSITSIGTYAFSGCTSLTDFAFPKSITSISERMLAGTGLVSVVIPDHITEIGDYAFSSCKSLVSATVPDYGTSIGTGVFGGCTSLTDFTFPKSMTRISDNMLAGTGLVSVVIPDHITEIGDGAFKNCQSLVSATVPDHVTSIGDGVFEGCIGITDFTFPESMTRISGGMLAGTGLVSVVIPDHITEIGSSAFDNCKSLVSVTVPGSVTSIKSCAFGGCPELKELRFLGDAPTFETIAFFNSVITAYYPKDNQTWTLVVYQNYGGRVTWVAEEAQPFEFVGASVSLGESLDFHFFIDDEDAVSTDYAEITRAYADGRENQVITVPYADWNALEDGTLYITYPGIAAKEMGDTLSIAVYNKDGKAISEIYADSIQTYAMRMLEKESDPELLTLLVDMLGYGAEAQNYFGYDAENPVNGDLTEVQKGYATAAYEAEDLLEAGDGRAATALTLKNRISLDLFFDSGVTGTGYASLYATVSYTDHYGDAQQLRIEGEDFIESEGNRVCVSVPGLAVADYGQAVTCTVYDAEGNAIAWVTDSIGGYVARMADDIPDIVAAIAKFGTAARNYFH